MKRPLSWPTKGRSYLSLRSGAAQTQILSVKGRDQKGKTFEAGFSPPHQWTVFAGVAGILGVFGLIFKNKIRFTLAGAVLAFSSYAWALDYTYWSRIYPYSKEISPGKEFQERRLLELEKWRQRVFSLGQERVGIDWDQYKRVAFLITPQNKPPQKIHGAYLWFEEGKKVRGFPNGPWTGPSRHPLVFFLGTSQLYGTGASSLEQSGVGIFLHLLHQKLHRKIYGLNLSQSGATLKILLPRFQELLKSLTPDVLVVNLGHNDSSQSSKDLEAQVAVLFRECRQRNIRVVVSLEGSSKEDDRPYEALKVLKQAATENHFLIVDSRAFFRRPETLQRGVLFWDEVHLTPFGQRLWAENIFQKAPWASLLAGAR
jgi:lysophospholipase L1-like esterase